MIRRIELHNFASHGDTELEFANGKNVIIGATGSGKTTLVNLIPRFYDVTDGRVMIDGRNIRQLRQDSLLSRISMVPQETVLFSGTVRDNIRYGRPGAEAGWHLVMSVMTTASSTLAQSDCAWPPQS